MISIDSARPQHAAGGACGHPDAIRLQSKVRSNIPPVHGGQIGRSGPGSVAVGSRRGKVEAAIGADRRCLRRPVSALGAPLRIIDIGIDQFEIRRESGDRSFRRSLILREVMPAKPAYFRLIVHPLRAVGTPFLSDNLILRPGEPSLGLKNKDERNGKAGEQNPNSEPKNRTATFRLRNSGAKKGGYDHYNKNHHYAGPPGNLAARIMGDLLQTGNLIARRPIASHLYARTGHAI